MVCQRLALECNAISIHLAPDWSDAQLEFYFQKICARWQIDYLALRQGEPSMDHTGDKELDEARGHIAGLMAGFLKVSSIMHDVMARNAYAVAVLRGEIAPNVNVTIHPEDDAPNPG